MESKFLLRDEAKVAIASLDTRLDHKETLKPSSSCSCSSRGSKCCDKTTECLCSACLLCVCCPLAIVWGCWLHQTSMQVRVACRKACEALGLLWIGDEGFYRLFSFSDNDISESLPSNTRTCFKQGVVHY